MTWHFDLTSYLLGVVVTMTVFWLIRLLNERER
jgi:hypothetical protein